jgi:hypothetical protein
MHALIREALPQILSPRPIGDTGSLLAMAEPSIGLENVVCFRTLESRSEQVGFARGN